MNDNNFNSPKDKEFLKSQVDSGEIIPIDFSVVEKVHKTDLISIDDPDTLIESVNNITTAYENFGKEFGIEIKYDVHSVSSTFKSLVSSNSETVFKVYLAKSFSKIKLAVFNKILISITTLVDRITQKEILESDNIELSVALVEQLMNMMEKLCKMSEDIEIKSADTVLKKVAKEISVGNSGNESDLSNEEIMKVLKQIKAAKK
jgi:hypothetical protein